ncbi:M48 family metalloprotease [Waterburya agarophytonicola K14]|uniref:M48 family metalloprotease n=1 Tax=Waterburya agarophytonicola KI4 TaxID=2874699 RepID=A0A964BRG4_9CYAN|nr:M48 family metalloprotease [Waterburya agarophytonicola]MCC0178080.1 M48 family metalloprotease [Waterburya agarophytonicola KI4]
MEQSSKSSTHLNPFAFPSETDIRFLLLVLSIAGSTIILIQTLVGIFFESPLITIPFALIVTVSLFIVALYQTRQFASKTIRVNRWEDFPPAVNDPALSTSLQQMNCYIQQTIDNVPELTSTKIHLIWDETSKSSSKPDGQAFGFGRKQYVRLKKGLHDAFMQFPELPIFQSVLMHELGHIANRDASKTVLTKCLSRCFFPIAIFSLISFNLYTIWELGDRLIREISLNSARSGILEIVNINIKLIILLLIVEISRSSILRVREYSADARARNWLGTSTPIIKTFSEENSQENSAKFKIWTFLQKLFQLFRAKIAPNHPTNKQRIIRLKNPRYFFDLSHELALLAGFLSGVSLNSNLSILTISPNVVALIEKIYQEVRMASEPNLSVILAIVLFFGLAIVFLATFLAIFVIFGLIPIVGTVGLQIQQAAFADLAQPKQKRLLTLQKLITSSLTLGIGFILGCLLTPSTYALSIRTAEAGISWSGILGLVIGWTSIFLIWEMSIAKLAGSIYLNHIEPNTPRQKIRWLMIFSAILLLPLLLWMGNIQMFFGAQAVNPDLFDFSQLAIWSIISGVLAFIVFGIILFFVWVSASRKGWLKKPQCPKCQSIISNKSGLLKNCPVCHHPIANWAWLPLPISFPSPPPPESTFAMDSPPPL